MDFWQILGQSPNKQQNLQNPWISAKNLWIFGQKTEKQNPQNPWILAKNPQIFGRLWVKKLENNKIHGFQLKIHGFWADFRSEN